MCDHTTCVLHHPAPPIIAEAVFDTGPPPDPGTVDRQIHDDRWRAHTAQAAYTTVPRARVSLGFDDPDPDDRY